MYGTYMEDFSDMYGYYSDIQEASISDTMTISDNVQHWKKQSEDLEVDWKNRVTDGGE